MSHRRKPETITVSPHEFVKAWQQSNSVAEVAQKIRSKKNAIRVRAHRYRDRGIPFKEFPPVEYVDPEEFWPELAKYAESLLPEADRSGVNGD
jgi:hypothetical protein